MSTRSVSQLRGWDDLSAPPLTLIGILLTICLVAAVHSAGLLALEAVAGSAAFVGLMVLFRRAPYLAGALVVFGIAVEPTVAFFVSPSVGPVKDVAALAGVGALVISLRHGLPAERRRFDAWMVGAVLLLIALYLVNPAGGHGTNWATETRLVVEALGLLLVGYLGPQPQRTWKWMVGALVTAGLVNVFVGVIEQVIGPTRLILDFHFAFGYQVRETSGGQFRSFGTFADPFSYAELLILALAAAAFSLRRSSRSAVVLALLTLGIVLSLVRTELALLVVLAALALASTGRISSAVAVLLAVALAGLTVAGLAGLTVAGLPPQTSPPTSSQGSFLLSVNGRAAAWSKILRPSVDLVAGRGVGTVGTGLTSNAGVQPVTHYQPGLPIPKQAPGSLAFVDSTYLTTLAEVGIPGLLLLLVALVRMGRAGVIALRGGSAAGWSVIAMLTAVAIDALTRSAMLAYPFGFIAMYAIGTGLAAAEAETPAPATLAGLRGRAWSPSGLVGNGGALAGDLLRRRPRGRGQGGYRPLQGLLAALVSRGGSRVLGLVFLVILARHQTPRVFATYSYLLVLAAAASLVTDSGIALVAGREVARGQLSAAAAYRGALPVQLLTCIVAGLGVALVAMTAPGPGATVSAAAVTGLFIFANGILNLQSEILRGAGRPWVEATMQAWAGALQLILGSWVVFSGYGLTALFVALAASQIVAVIAAQFFLPWPWSGRGSDAQIHWRELLRQGLWLGGATTCLALVMRLPQLLLSNVGSVAQTAHFAIASRYADLIATVCVTAGFGLLPAMSRRLSTGEANAARFPRQVLVQAGAAALVSTPILVLLAPGLTTLVFGQRYRGAGPAAQIIVGMFPLMVVLYLSWYGLIAHRRERRVLVSGFSSLVVLGIGIVWIAVRATAVAAAEATVAAVAVAAVLAAASLLTTSAPDDSGSGTDGRDTAGWNTAGTEVADA